MKYCSHCGKEITDEAVVCVGCGCPVPNTQINTTLPAIDTSEKKTKFCSHCGKEIDKNAVICIGCGCAVPNIQTYDTQVAINNNVETNKTITPSRLKTAAKILMIISTVLMGFYIITLAWTIPMTLNLSKKIKTGEPISTSFKICTLIFVSGIAGILLLCDKE